ncbi:nucleotidyltransferase family protein [Methanobrevibacter olleyae]|nr:nucleotidyltransferase domain-containing protein [Methanobrevibacter olleyae]
MVVTVEDIQKRIIPIVMKYGINSISLFGSYAKGNANEDSDLDFVMDKGELRGLIQYISLVEDLEEEFNCHVDLVSKGSSNKKFLNAIKKDEVLLYERER